MSTDSATTSPQKAGPKFVVNIEGVNHDWSRPIITVPEIRELGGIAQSDPIIEVDLKDNSERTIPEDEVVDIKPGMGFGKKVSFKRGRA